MSEREGERGREGGRERERETATVCVSERERLRLHHAHVPSTIIGNHLLQ